MQSQSTYGDNLTLMALAREFNCQFLVFNSLGDNYHCLISNTNIYDDELPLLTLGYYPEERGEHYVSVEIEGLYLKHLLHIVGRGENREVGCNDRFTDSDQTQKGKSESMKGSANEMNVDEIREDGFSEYADGYIQSDTEVFFAQKIDITSGRVHTSTADNQYATLLKDKTEELNSIIVNEDIQDENEVFFNERLELSKVHADKAILLNDSSDDRSLKIADENIQDENEVCANQRVGLSPVHIDTGSSEKEQEEGNAAFLPNLVLDNIISTTVRMYPAMLFTLQHVSRYFMHCIERIGYPLIYLSPALLYDVPRRISVCRLTRLYGRNSGLMIAVREALRESNRPCAYAWLSLAELDNRWFEIRDVHWR